MLLILIFPNAAIIHICISLLDDLLQLVQKPIEVPQQVAPMRRLRKRGVGRRAAERKVRSHLRRSIANGWRDQWATASIEVSSAQSLMHCSKNDTDERENKYELPSRFPNSYGIQSIDAS